MTDCNDKSSSEDTALWQSALPDLADLLSKVLHQCDVKTVEGRQLISNEKKQETEIQKSDSPRCSSRRSMFVPEQKV